jgi:hypothetical protein
MKKNFNPAAAVSLRKLVAVAMETATEIVDKKKAWAFINNAFQIIDLGDELPELGAEVQYIKEHPGILEAIQNEEIAKYPKHENDIIIKTVRKIIAAVIYNVSTGLSIAEDWKQHNTNK